MTKEQQIENYMKMLKISKEEAEQLWEDDQEDFIGEAGEEMTLKAKQIKRYEQKDSSRKKTSRTQKIDEIKVSIIQYLVDALESRYKSIKENEWDFSNVFVKNPQKEITFTIDNCEYSLNLIKHRPKK